MDMVLYTLLKKEIQNFKTISGYVLKEVDKLPSLEERDDNTIYILKKVGE